MSTTWHQEVRNRNIEELISTAQELFLKYDFSSVNLKLICSTAKISRVTFYKCFSSIDELAFAVQIKVLSEFTDFVMDRITTAVSGLDQLKSYIAAWLKFATISPGHFKYIGFFDHYYRENYPEGEWAAKYKSLIKHGELGTALTGILQEGVKDGSIREDIELKLVGASIFGIIMSILQRMTSRGKLIQQEQEFDFERVVNTVFDMIISFVKK